MKEVDYNVMFLDDYWNYLQKYIKDSFSGWGSGFSIQSIDKNEIKRAIIVLFDISDYNTFRDALKYFKKKLKELDGYLSNPISRVQFKDSVVTLYVKPQDAIYNIEDFEFSDADFLKWRREYAYYSFCSKQLEYWQKRLDSVREYLCSLRKEEIFNYDSPYYLDELNRMIAIETVLEENVKWYFEKVEAFQHLIRVNSNLLEF